MLQREICPFCSRGFSTLPGLRVHLANQATCRDAHMIEQHKRDQADRSYSNKMDEDVISDAPALDIEASMDIASEERGLSPMGDDCMTDSDSPLPHGLSAEADSAGMETSFRQAASTVNVRRSVPEPDDDDDFEEPLAGIGTNVFADSSSNVDDDEAWSDPGLNDDTPHNDEARYIPSQVEVDGATESAGIGGSTTFRRFKHEGAARHIRLGVDVPDDPAAPTVSDFEHRRENEIPGHPYHPFRSCAEWELVKWLCIWNIPKGAIDEFIKLEWVSELFSILNEIIPMQMHRLDSTPSV